MKFTRKQSTTSHAKIYEHYKIIPYKLDVHRSVHHNTDLMGMTNKMQLCRTIYYSIVP